MVQFYPLEQTTFADDDDIAGMGRSLWLAARPGEPHAAFTADLHAGALRRVAGLATRRPRAPLAIKRAAVPTSALAFPDFERSAVQGEARPFNTGRTLIDARTAETWRSLTHRAVRRLGANDLGYADPAGLAEL